MAVRGRTDSLSALSHLTPASIRAPFANYSHGVVVESGARMLFCSGQLGIDSDESIPDDVRAQTELCFANINAILSQARMSPANVIRVNTYVTDRAHLVDYMSVRDEFFEAVQPPPASTLMIVTGFARKDFKVEVEVIAAGDEPASPEEKQ